MHNSKNKLIANNDYDKVVNIKLEFGYKISRLTKPSQNISIPTIPPIVKFWEIINSNHRKLNGFVDDSRFER